MRELPAVGLRRLFRLRWIVLVAVLVRVLAALYLGDVVGDVPGAADQLSYHTLAVRLLNGHGFTFGENWWPLTKAGAPTAHWSYLYTLSLTGIYGLFGPHPLAARLLQAIVAGLAHPLLAYRLGLHVGRRATALVAAALTALYPYFVYYSATLMTESLFIIFVLAQLLLLAELAGTPQRPGRKQVLLLGLSAGAAILLRQLFLLLLPFLWLWWWGVHYRRERRVPLKSSLAAAMLVAAMILPFTAYNYLQFDRVVLLNTNAGYAFFFGNHPIYGTRFEPILPPEMGSYLDLIPREVRPLDEVALEKELMRRAITFVRDDPVRYARLSLSRIPPYFEFRPSRDSDLLSNVARTAGFGLLLPFMLLGIWQWLRAAGRGHRVDTPASLLLLFALLYTILHVLTWTLVRYRLPVDAVLLVFAANALYPLARRAIGAAAPAAQPHPRRVEAVPLVPGRAPRTDVDARQI